MAEGEVKPIAAKLEIDQGFIRMYFHVETTGWKKPIEIVQLAAKSGNKEFNLYLMPTIAIEGHATEVNGLRTGDGVLYYNGEAIETVESSEAAEQFMEYMREVGGGSTEPKIILLAHNCKRYFRHQIYPWLVEKGKKDDITKLVFSFCDVMELWDTATLEELIAVNVPSHIWVNRAYEKCLATEALGNEAKPERILEKMTTLSSFVLYFEFKSHEITISEKMCKNMADAGITMEKLKIAFDENGQEGLALTLKDVGVKITNIALNKMQNYFSLMLKTNPQTVSNTDPGEFKNI